MIDQFTGQILADKYRIGSVLRKSDLGTIYHGTHLMMDKPVTVKILSPALAVDGSIVKQFSAEARTASQFSHPNILNVTDFGSDTAGTVYIVFEGVEGQNLEEIITSQGMLAPGRAVNIIKQAASALAAAHANNVVHGGLSSDTLVISGWTSEDETVKVLNFASAKVQDPLGMDSEHMPVSEVEYLSPEQCTDTGEPDARSDIYSLGVIFYEMVAGELPFSGENATQLMLKHSQEIPPPLSAYRQDLPPELEPVLLKALAKDPDLRYQTAEEFITDLETIPEVFVPAEAKAAAAAAPPNNIWKTAFIVLIGIMVLASALIYATSSKQTNPTTQLQPDLNGLPVQPINPATGTDEQALANMVNFGSAEYVGNSNMAIPPGTIAGGDGMGDGYNPWATSAPPAGAPPPQYIPPGGQTVTIDPNGGSIFMPGGGGDGVVLVPVPANTAPTGNTAVPAKTPKTTPGSTNSNPTPPAGPDGPAKPAPKPMVTPDVPGKNPPAKKTPLPKKTQSGKIQDS